MINKYSVAPIKALKNPVVVLGSARENRDSQNYAVIYEMSKKLGIQGHGVVTGGNEGVMEAASRGAFDSGKDVSACISSLDDETFDAKYVSPGLLIEVRNQSERNVLMAEEFDNFVVFPGGLGTLNELTYLIMYASKIRKIKIILVGVEFWRPLKNWLIDRVLIFKYVDEDDLSNISIVDSVNKVYEALEV